MGIYIGGEILPEIVAPHHSLLPEGLSHGPICFLVLISCTHAVFVSSVLLTEHLTLSAAIIFSVFSCACIHAHTFSCIVSHLSVELKQPHVEDPPRKRPGK